MESAHVVSGTRFTVTRNVLQVKPPENKVFFLFKKDVLYFIDECEQDGNFTLYNLAGKDVYNFATAGMFYYSVDTKFHDDAGNF